MEARALALVFERERVRRVMTRHHIPLDDASAFIFRRSTIEDQMK
jgi:hypothetical protein